MRLPRAVHTPIGEMKIQTTLALILFLAALIIAFLGLTGVEPVREHAWPSALISIILAIIFWIFGRRPPI